MKRLLFLTVLCLLIGGWLSAQSALFSPTPTNEVPSFLLDTETIPVNDFSRLRLDVAALTQQLVGVPAEGDNSRAAVTISLPSPDGGHLSVRLEDSPVMHPALAARFPGIKSYRAHTTYGTGRIAVSHKGMTAAIMGPDGEYFINPAIPESNEHYLMYYNRDINLSLAENSPELSCGWDPDQAIDDALLNNIQHPSLETGSGRSPAGVPVSMYQYDLALTCTGEFAQLKGGTEADVMAAFNESVSLLNAILERETASRFQLISNNDDLIFTDPASDPYTQADEGGALLNQIQNAIVNFAGIPLGTFDLGHLFTAACTDVGGVVGGQACTAGKTRGVTCHYTQSIPAIVRRVMSHEIAHQFAVGHSWNNCPPSITQLASGSAFEPGSGSTIMSYAGTCGSENNVQGNSDDYYHVGSLDQFYQFSRVIQAGCATILDPENNSPDITLTYEDGFFIPISTPFELSGTATDEDGDDLEYNWEQYDLGPSNDLGDPSLNSPLFRSYPPSALGSTRVFPRLNNVINNTSTDVEVLPTYSRDLTFRMTVRDNNPAAGASVWETIAFRSTADAGPFLVTFPNNGDEMITAGEYLEITWDVANTDQAPVNCELVNIRLSTDGGQTYPTTLLENAGNSGSAFVTIPIDVVTGNARIRVDAADNIFFDISNNSFPIVAPTAPGYTLDAPQYIDNVCLPDVVSVTFSTESILNFSETIELSIDEDMLPAGITTSFSASSIDPGQSTTLTIDLTNSDFDGLLDLVVNASAEGIDPAVRVITLDVINNDYSDLELNSPAEGVSDIQLATDFDWTDAQYADTYDFQIATSPDFAPGNIFEEAAGLTITEFEQTDFFDANTLYFWRVRPINECGPGEWADPRSFRTISVNCTDYVNTDVLILPGQGSLNRESEIFVAENGTISDINIPNITFTYGFVNNVSIFLESPAGTRVELYDEDCGGFTQNFNLGFDDQAPNVVNCPPDDQQVFLPHEALSAFDGENTFGTWILNLRASGSGETGTLTNWEIEFCASSNAEAPFIVNNNTTLTGPLVTERITTENLRVGDNNFGAADRVFTLVRAPRFGYLELSGSEIGAGATFTQQDIYNFALFYVNTDADANEDDFAFVVENPDGGYIPVNYHNIIIDAILDVEPQVNELDRPLIFPNPVNDQLQLRWAVSTSTPMDVQLLDVAGRLLGSFKLPTLISNYTIDVSELPAGVYFLKVGNYTERIMKQ